MRESLDQVLFECATFDAERALELWNEVVVTVRFPELSDSERRLLPAVWKNLSSLGVPVPGEKQLRGLYRYTWMQNLKQQNVCKQVIRLFEAAGIPTIALKGIVLSADVYEDLGTRPAHDFDLLVPFEQAVEAVAVLEADGWLLLEPDDFVSPALRLGQAAPFVKNGVEFDMHWFALREARNPGDDDAFWAEARMFSLGDVETLVLNPTHQLVHLLANGTREPENCYRFLLDLKLFLKKYRDEVDFAKVRSLLAERHLLHRLSYLPDLGEGLQDGAPTLLDRCWSWCSRYVNDGSGELLFGLFPFLDYWLHFAGRPDSPVTVWSYFQHRLRIRGWGDLVARLRGKIMRLIGGGGGRGAGRPGEERG